MNGKMRKGIIGGLTALLFLLPPCAALAQEPPETGAAAYALVEASTGRLLAGQNEREELPMASTTKTMTAILAIERGDLEEMVQVPRECAGVEGSSVYLRAGETLTLRELLYGLMLASGNDAACTIATHIGGSLEGFAEMMNDKARELGAAHTHFVTPHGLPCEDHYTTAEDLARIAAYAMQNETFREIVGTKSLDLPEDGDSPARYLRNKNRLLTQYEGANGVKTGYTDAAGKCLVGGAERGGMQLISVVLNDRGMFEDSEALLDYGFSEYSMQRAVRCGEPLGELEVEKGEQETVGFTVKEDIFLPLRADEGNMVIRKLNLADHLEAPVREDAQVGTLEIFLDGACIRELPVYPVRSIKKLSVWQRLMRALTEGSRMRKH